MFPPCLVTAETTALDVGRGVAIVDVRARLRAAGEGNGGCSVDLGASLLAREEGRGPPELIAWRADLDGRLLHLGGSMGKVALELPRAGVLRVRALLRGERFVAAPIATEPMRRGPSSTFRVRASSVWRSAAVFGVARWIDVGTPIVALVDPTRDHEPMTLLETIGAGEPSVIVVDAGPLLGGAPEAKSPETRGADLAAGGARALSVLLTDLPLAVATAPDETAAIARLRETALASLAAASSDDPLLAAVGQRLATALVTGFLHCARGDVVVPPRFPLLPRALEGSGVLEDDEAGCPRVHDLLVANHPSFAVDREAHAALDEAVAANAADRPAIGRLVKATLGGERLPPHRQRSSRGSRRAFAIALVLALLAGLGLVVARERG